MPRTRCWKRGALELAGELGGAERGQSYPVSGQSREGQPLARGDKLIAPCFPSKGLGRGRGALHSGEQF